MIQNYKILRDVFYKLKITKKVHMAGIIRHYKLLEMVAEQGVEFHSTVLNLCRAYSEFRPVHGDGECFYRSFIFSYLSKFFIGRIHMRNTVFFLVLPCFGYQSPALQPRAQCPFWYAVAYWYKLHRQVLCWSTTILRQQQQAQDAATQLRLSTLFALFPYWDGSLNLMGADLIATIMLLPCSWRHFQQAFYKREGSC